MTGFIDVHSHAVLHIGQEAPMEKQPDWSVQGALDIMDENGISASVLSVPDAANHATGDAARDIARRVNEGLAGIVADHPHRFGAMACIPGADPDGAMVEIAHALDSLGMDGVSTSTSINDVYLGDASYDPWFAELDRRRATLFVHPVMAKASKPVSLGINASVLEFMFDSTRMLANMVIGGARKRFANIPIISTHGGGTLPYLLERIQTLEGTYGSEGGRTPLSAAELREGFESFHYDLTAATSHAQLTALLDLVPVSRLVMGFDYPFMPAGSFPAAITELSRFEPLSDPDRESIAHGAAERLYPKLAQRMAAAR